MDWENFWGTAIAVIPIATVVTLLVNWFTTWLNKPRPLFDFETQMTIADYAIGMTGGQERTFVAMTNIGNGPAYFVTIDGHNCDVGVNLPPLKSVTKERVVNYVARIDPGEVVAIELGVKPRMPNDPALIVKWKTHPGRVFPPAFQHMKTVKLASTRPAAFLPVGFHEAKPLPRLFRRWRNLTKHTSRWLEELAPSNQQESKSPDQEVSATPSNATASGSQDQPTEQ